MSDSEKIRMRSTLWESYAWVLAVVWTVVIGASLMWNVFYLRHNILEATRHHARSAFEKDLIWRRWVTGRGGVYVPVSEEKANIHLQETNRLKTVFLATMSHELRTPLNSIIGFTGIVLQGLAGPLSDEQTKQLGMIRDSARHLLNLINDILAWYCHPE